MSDVNAMKTPPVLLALNDRGRLSAAPDVWRRLPCAPSDLTLDVSELRRIRRVAPENMLAGIHSVISFRSNGAHSTGPNCFGVAGVLTSAFRVDFRDPLAWRGISE